MLSICVYWHDQTIAKLLPKVKLQLSFGSTDDAVDTDTALAFFRSMFNSAKFNDRVPPIIFKHQLYSVVNNRTQVDRDIVSHRTLKNL